MEYNSIGRLPIVNRCRVLNIFKEYKAMENIKEIEGLIRIQDMDDTIEADLRYAGEDNFTGRKVYPADVCLLQKATAEKLVRANTEFAKRGLRLKIWDAYRPLYVQRFFWALVSDTRFVADPSSRCWHTCGVAVDVTLVDKDGREIEMPTGFDDFSEKAFRSFRGNSKEAQGNVDYLTDVMVRNGFMTIDTEWWHFEDTDREKYHELKVRLEDF